MLIDMMEEWRWGNIIYAFVPYVVSTVTMSILGTDKSTTTTSTTTTTINNNNNMKNNPEVNSLK
jgi:hypothetical protein